MKLQYTSRTLFFFMVLLANLSAFAQNGMVGDGFGGRAGYNPVNIRCGYQFGLGICGTNNQPYVWGTAQYAQNTGSLYANATPAAVANVNNVRQFSVGNTIHTYIKADGTGYVFGNATPNNNSVISNAYYSSSDGAIKLVSFVKTDGTVWVGGSTGIAVTASCTFGNNNPSSYCLVKIPNINTAKRVESGGNSGAIIMLLADGTVQTFGGSSSYLPASLISPTTPIPVPGLSNIVDIKTTDGNFYALNSSGQVYSWGGSSGMGTGVANNGTTYLPQLITFPAGAAPIKAISGSKGSKFAMALDENGNLYIWGTNGAGALGQGSTVSFVSSPVLLATNVRDMASGTDFAYIFKNDNTIWGAGINGYGSLMDLPTGSINSPYAKLTPPATLCAISSFTGMPPCVAGTTAPAVTPTTATNSCPATTVNLTSLAISSTTPSGAKLIWSTHKTPTSAGDTLTTAQKTAVSTAGTYYAMYYDATNACYSPADSVTLTITSCVAPLSASNPAAQTATTGQAKTGNAATELAPTGGVSPYTYSDGAGDAACVAPSGATALTGLTVNSDGTYSYTAPTAAGTYYYCIKVCDSATPTASCVVKTYTLTVTTTALPLTANNPAAQTATTGQAKTGNAATELAPTGGVSPYTYSNGAGDAACVAPSGATALTGLTVNSDGSYSYTAPATAGTYYYCIKVCDSATPTASCVVKTYTLTVTATASCNAGTVAPMLIKN